MIPLHVRIRDWLADHFRSIQYAKPRRAPKRDHSFWREFGREGLRLGVIAGAFVLFLWRYRNTPGMRVLGLFAAALMAWCATHMVSLLF